MLPRIIRQGQDEPASLRKWLLNFDATAYHADKEAISQGALREIERSPAHFIHSFGSPFSSTSPILRLGTLVHLALLEPAKYARYELRPHLGDGRTKEGKAAKKEWIASLAPSQVLVDENGERTDVHPDALIMTVQEKTDVEGMAANVLANPRLRNLMQGAMTEATTYWIDEESRLLCRARLDIVTPDIIMDLKTTEDAREVEFSRSIERNDYDFQGASYIDAANATVGNDRYRDFIFVALERNAPYEVRAYLLDSRALARGAARRRAALMTLARCIETNTWPGYSDEIATIDLPPWAYGSAQREAF